jgi:spoIIIJ-associated protein
MLEELVAEQPSNGEEDYVAFGRKSLQRILDGLAFDTEVEAEATEEQLRLTVIGEDAELAIGKKGQTLDALQFLLGKMVSKLLGRRMPVWVDACGYRERRSDSLIQLANRLSEEVSESGQTVALNPMSPQDRRIIHMALKDTPGISTRSEGEGIHRRLFIVPEDDAPDHVDGQVDDQVHAQDLG